MVRVSFRRDVQLIVKQMHIRAASVNEIGVLLVDNGTFSDFLRFGFYRHSLIRLLQIDLCRCLPTLNS